MKYAVSGVRLGRHDIQPFADVFADDVTLRAATTGEVWCNNLFNTRQMFGQDTATNTRLWRRCLWRINDLILSMDYGHRRLNVFQCEVILIWVTLLGLRAVERAFEVGQQLFQPNDAVLLALNDAILVSHLRLRGQNNGLGGREMKQPNQKASLKTRQNRSNKWGNSMAAR